MIQTVYILELLRPAVPVRAHFAQSEGAARRATERYRLGGRWESLEPPQDGVVSRLLDGNTALTQVCRDSLEYG